jgi:hypothetical protein
MSRWISACIHVLLAALFFAGFTAVHHVEHQRHAEQLIFCVWQAGLAHFGILFWPTPGTLKIWDYSSRGRRGGGNVGIAAKRFPRSVGRVGKQFHRFPMLSIDRQFHRHFRLTSLFRRHRVAAFASCCVYDGSGRTLNPFQ